MTDERDIDGWVVVHYGSHEGMGDAYGFGPFPTPDIAQYIATNSVCPCDKSIVPVLFPQGVRMVVEVETAIGFVPPSHADRQN